MPKPTKKPPKNYREIPFYTAQDGQVMFLVFPLGRDNSSFPTMFFCRVQRLNNGNVEKETRVFADLANCWDTPNAWGPEDAITNPDFARFLIKGIVNNINHAKGDTRSFTTNPCFEADITSPGKARAERYTKPISIVEKALASQLAKTTIANTDFDYLAQISEYKDTDERGYFSPTTKPNKPKQKPWVGSGSILGSMLEQESTF